MGEMRGAQQPLPTAASNREKKNESQGRLDGIPDADVVVSTCKGPGVRERPESSSAWLDHSLEICKGVFEGKLPIEKVVKYDKSGKNGAGNGHTSKVS
jgi:hypothetical protein